MQRACNIAGKPDLTFTLFPRPFLMVLFAVGVSKIEHHYIVYALDRRVWIVHSKHYQLDCFSLFYP